MKDITYKLEQINNQLKSDRLSVNDVETLLQQAYVLYSECQDRVETVSSIY
jgi:hypothetical protein